MGRFVIAIDGVKPGRSGNYNVTERLKNIFTGTGKIISENEVALVLINVETKYTDLPVILDTVNNYDMVKYINGYSRDIISIFTRVEVSVQVEGNDDGDAMPSLKDSYLEPVDIPEKSAIMNLMADGYLPLVFAPGAPVIKNLQYYISIDGIVEANMYSSLLATLLEADTFMIITEMQLKALNTGNPKENGPMKMDYEELREMYLSGYFKNTGMDNMIKSIISFISKGGKRSIIVPTDSMDFSVEILK
jgi:carbamate kinase